MCSSSLPLQVALDLFPITSIPHLSASSASLTRYCMLMLTQTLCIFNLSSCSTWHCRSFSFLSKNARLLKEWNLTEYWKQCLGREFWAQKLWYSFWIIDCNSIFRWVEHKNVMRLVFVVFFFNWACQPKFKILKCSL